MIDLRKLIAGLTRLVLAPDFPDANVIAEALRLDMSGANVATMKSGDLLIREVALEEGAVGADVIAMPPPRREFIVMFRRANLPYRAIGGEIFGRGQPIQKSRVGDGFAVVFQVDAFEFAITASSPDGAVEALSLQGRSRTGCVGRFDNGNRAPISWMSRAERKRPRAFRSGAILGQGERRSSRGKVYEAACFVE
jgi:hypothetical protein